MSKKVSRAPIADEELDGYTPRHSRIAPARQLCAGSNKEVIDRPKDDRCPVCSKKLTITVVPGQRKVREFSFGGSTDLTDTRTVSEVYIIPSHLMRHKT